jgi:hypothetical protein
MNTKNPLLPPDTTKNFPPLASMAPTDNAAQEAAQEKAAHVAEEATAAVAAREAAWVKELKEEAAMDADGQGPSLLG